MILIISSDDDLTTNDVIDWLRHFDAEFIRISDESKVRILHSEINNDKSDSLIEMDGKVVSLSEIKSCWYRRSWFSISKWGMQSSDNDLNQSINRQLFEENVYLEDFIENYLKNRMLNFKDDNKLNKLSALKIAVEVGLKIPDSIVTTLKSDVQKFAEKHDFKVISKNFSPGIFAYYKDFIVGTLTMQVSKEMVENLNDTFHPILLQEQINKEFELRIFFLNGEMYASAIMSQNDETTKVDFRNYNFEKANRTPPFELPNNLKERLTKLMSLLNLNSGSIDLLVNDSDEYIFLEVNPIGQFSQVSTPCNYYLEKKVADSLIYNKHERRN
jgi:ATP-GRASP peptide maturase of grasp-with-spasm system